MYSESYYVKYMFGSDNSEQYEYAVQEYLNLIKSFRELESLGKLTFDCSDPAWLRIRTNDEEIARKFGLQKEEGEEWDCDPDIEDEDLETEFIK